MGERRGTTKFVKRSRHIKIERADDKTISINNTSNSILIVFSLNFNVANLLHFFCKNLDPPLFIIRIFLLSRVSTRRHAEQMRLLFNLIVYLFIV